MRVSVNDYDSPWKNILDCFFQSFVEFCLPKAAAEINWSRGYVALDKELTAIARDHEIGKRVIDKLFKVWLKDGKEVWLLFHVEIQSQKEIAFSERMYIYNYRLFDRYKKNIVSVAILADNNLRWRPSSYERLSWYTEVCFKFCTIKLLDYANNQQSLLHSNNPFAIVILAHLQALKTRTQHEQRLQSKLAITRALYQRGFSKSYIIQLFRFIDWVMELPELFELQYSTTIEKIEEKKQMKYISSVERIIIKRETEKAIQEGRKEGMQQGLSQGREEGARALLQRQLQRQFGELPPSYQRCLDKADASQLDLWLDRLFKANTLDDIFIKHTAGQAIYD